MRFALLVYIVGAFLLDHVARTMHFFLSLAGYDLIFVINFVVITKNI